jgi:hypothetical protein
MSHHGCICMPRSLSGSLHLRSIPAVSWGEQLVADYAKGTKRDMGFVVTIMDGLNIAKGWDRQYDHPSKVIKALGRVL